MVESKKMRRLRADNGGNLPAFAWPGGYPVIYCTRDGLTVCPDCASASDASDPVLDNDIYWEGPAMQCDNCGKMIDSAYGDPNERE
jgi:hypothetical protein